MGLCFQQFATPVVTSTVASNTSTLFTYDMTPSPTQMPFNVLVVGRRTSGGTAGNGVGHFLRCFASTQNAMNRSDTRTLITAIADTDLADCSVSVTYNFTTRIATCSVTGPTGTTGDMSWRAYVLGVQNADIAANPASGATLERRVGEATCTDATTWVDVTWKDGATVNIPTATGKVYIICYRVKVFRTSDNDMDGRRVYAIARNVGGTLTIVGQTDAFHPSTFFFFFGPFTQLVASGTNLKLQVKGASANTHNVGAILDLMMEV